MLTQLKQQAYEMPPFRANARLSPKGGKCLNILQFPSFPLWGKDVRRTGRGLYQADFTRENLTNWITGFQFIIFSLSLIQQNLI